MSKVGQIEKAVRNSIGSVRHSHHRNSSQQFLRSSLGKSNSPASQRIQGKMKQLLKTRLAKKFNIDANNAILEREVEWYMANRETTTINQSFKQLESELRQLFDSRKGSITKPKIMPLKTERRLTMNDTIKPVPKVSKPKFKKPEIDTLPLIHTSTLMNLGMPVSESARLLETKHYSIKNLAQKINTREPPNLFVDGSKVNKFNTMSMLKKHLDEQIQHKKTKDAHEKYQVRHYETQILDDVKQFQRQEERTKQSKKLNQQKFRNEMQIQVQAKQLEEKLKKDTGEEAKMIKDVIEAEKEQEMRELLELRKQRLIASNVSKFNFEQIKVKTEQKRQNRQDQIQGSLDYQRTLDDYDNRKQAEVSKWKNKLKAHQDKQQMASVDPQIEIRRKIDEQRKIDEYQERLYVRDYTTKKMQEDKRRQRELEIKQFSDQIIAAKTANKKLDLEEDRMMARTMALL